MTDNERLANEIVEQAYARMAEGSLEPGDKVVIVLARNNDSVQKLIHKLCASTGRPLTALDRAKAAMSTVAVSGATVAVLLTLLALWDQVS